MARFHPLAILGVLCTMAEASTIASASERASRSHGSSWLLDAKASGRLMREHQQNQRADDGSEHDDSDVPTPEIETELVIPPVDCQYAEWSDWVNSTATCGNATVSRERRITVHAQNGGFDCEGDKHQTMNLTLLDCTGAAACFWSDWNDWSPWDSECAGQKQNRTRDATGNKLACDKALGRQYNYGNLTIPCNVDCIWSAWSHWSHCSVTCEAVGQRRMFRNINVQSSGDGIPCSNHDGTCLDGNDTLLDHCFERYTDCNRTSIGCPVDCSALDWGDWGTCLGACGPAGDYNVTGTTYRSRNTTGPFNGGASCFRLTVLDEGNCQFDCSVQSKPTSTNSSPSPSPNSTTTAAPINAPKSHGVRFFTSLLLPQQLLLLLHIAILAGRT